MICLQCFSATAINWTGCHFPLCFSLVPLVLFALSLSLSFLLRQPAIGNDQIVKMLEKPLTVMFVVKLSERRSTATAVQAGPLLPSLTASISNFAGASFVFRIWWQFSPPQLDCVNQISRRTEPSHTAFSFLFYDCCAVMTTNLPKNVEQLQTQCCHCCSMFWSRKL